MDLWIRSQDRECLLKTDIVMMEVITKNEEYWICAGYDMYDPCKVFGVYHSKERALEVLDEIENHLINSSFAKKINGLGEVKDIIPNPLFVYEMPKE